MLKNELHLQNTTLSQKTTYL